MNKIYLDEDRTIEAEISSDASIQADEYYGKERKITTKNFTNFFNIYIEEVRKDLNRLLNAILRDFHDSISVFVDEQQQTEKYRKTNLKQLLFSWKQKLQQFQETLQNLKSHAPYIRQERTKHRFPITKKTKFPQIVDKFINRIQSQHSKNDNTSKINIQREIANTQSLYDQGRYEEAIIKIKEILKNNSGGGSGSPELHFLLGNCYKIIGNYHQAIHQYDKAIRVSPKGCYFNNRGNCYLCIQDVIKAEQDYKKAIKEEPNNEVFLGNYGNVCLSLKKYQDAIISYNLALKQGSPNDFFYNNRAFAQIKLRRYDQAIQSYNQAINLSPYNHIYYKNRANLYMQKGNTEKALRDIKQAIQIDQKKHEYYFLKGKWEYFAKKPKEALLSFRKACELEPGKKIYLDYYVAVKEEISQK